MFTTTSKFFLFVFISFLSLQLTTAQELEIGPMLNYESTSFNIPDSSFIVIGGPGGGGEGSRTTGYEGNISFGAYGSYYFNEKLAVSAELFYTTTSATEFKEVGAYTSINLIPYVSIEFFLDNLFLNLGGGFAYILDTPDFENTDLESKSFDIPLKMAFTYRIPTIATVDLGIHSSVTRVVKDEILRTAYYIGVKVPINTLLKKKTKDDKE